MDDRLDLYHGGTYSTLELSYIPVPIQLITQGPTAHLSAFLCETYGFRVQPCILRGGPCLYAGDCWEVSAEPATRALV